MLAAIRRWVDPFIVLLVCCMLAGVLFPIAGHAAHVFSIVTDVAISVLFLVYGMRISTREAWEGLKNWRLHGAILSATFIMFPLIGLAIQPIVRPLLGPMLSAGLLYLTLLPSTVQSSVAFTSIAKGNVAAAICAASLSNVLGMLITPALVALLMGGTGIHLTFSSLGSILLQMLLPFVVGQLLQPKVGGFVRRQKWLSTITDRGVILMVVYSAFSEGIEQHIWTGLTVDTILLLLVVAGVVLVIALAVTWNAGKWFKFPRADRVALLMCGSKKSLATGVPMAQVLFASVPGMAAAVTLPVMVFHQLQLITCAFIARKLARDVPVQLPPDDGRHEVRAAGDEQQPSTGPAEEEGPLAAR